MNETRRRGGKAGAVLPSNALDWLGPGALDDFTVRRWVLEMLRPGGPVCPVCGERLSRGQSDGYYAGRRFQCGACAKWCTAFTGTILHGAKISPEQFYLIAALTGLDIPTGRIAKIAGVNRETARQWRRRLTALEQAHGEADHD